MPMPASDLGPDVEFMTRVFNGVFGELYTITVDGRLICEGAPLGLDASVSK
jgi:hypothetical protein